MKKSASKTRAQRAIPEILTWTANSTDKMNYEKAFVMTMV